MKNSFQQIYEHLHFKLGKKQRTLKKLVKQSLFDAKGTMEVNLKS